MAGKINSINNLVNNIVSRKTAENRKINDDENGNDSAYKKDSGDAIEVSELGQKLKQLLNYLETEASLKEKVGFHFIMEEFIHRPDSYDIINFVDSQLFLLENRIDYLIEVLNQAYNLKEQELNPVLWLGVYSRLLGSEAINFIYVTSWIFRYQDRSLRIKNLVTYLEEVRRIIDENSFKPIEYRAELIYEAGKDYID
ncbi:MAG: hypothetical protein ABR596_07575 [Halarsenatibacteraceae bacterium]